MDVDTVVQYNCKTKTICISRDQIERGSTTTSILDNFNCLARVHIWWMCACGRMHDGQVYTQAHQLQRSSIIVRWSAIVENGKIITAINLTSGLSFENQTNSLHWKIQSLWWARWCLGRQKKDPWTNWTRSKYKRKGINQPKYSSFHAQRVQISKQIMMLK